MKKQVFLFFIILILPLVQFSILIDLNNHSYNQVPDSINLNHLKSQDVLKLSADFDAGDKIGLKSDLWSDNLTGNDVTVAILDTGILANHSVFTNDGVRDWNERIVKFFDVIENKSTLPQDVHGHGTWAASILAGNSTEYQGVAPNASLVILKIFDHTGETNASVLSSAVDWILANKAIYDIKIVSMSFGAKPESDNQVEISWIQNVVKKLVEEGILVVAAAGNEGDSSKDYGDRTINSPASEKTVLAVGGVDYEGEMYPNSAKGPTFEGEIKPDVCAPAISINGADKDYNDDYYPRSGTSGATPFVAGLAALMLEKTPSLNPMEIKNILSLTSIRTINPKILKDNIQGWGVIQGYAALDALNPPILLHKDIELFVSLNQNTSVKCLPVDIYIPDTYFFELIQLNNTSAEMFLFNSQPDSYGRPILLGHSLSGLNIGAVNKRMGANMEKPGSFYLVIKLVDTGPGSFLLRFVEEYSVISFIILLGVNIIGLIYIGNLTVKFKKQESRI